jgi:aryl-alcohol dehydrogenase-like predicted oxidoreductase
MMRTTTLGGLTVSAQGLGCMGMSEFYGHTDWDESVATIHRAVAEAKGVAPAQVAIAWMYAQGGRLGVPIVPIPGTKRVRWLEENVAAMDVTLTPGELAVLDPLADRVVGSRY